MVKRNIRLLAWFNFFLDFRLYAPVAILYFTKVTNSFAFGMSIFSVVMVSSALMELPTGILSDRIGRKQTLLCGAVASAFAIVFYAVGGIYAMLFIGAILEGTSRAFFSGNNEALLYDTLAEDNQANAYQEIYGKVSSTSQVALAISAILGGIIASASYSGVMWLSLIPQVLNIGLAFSLVEPRIHRPIETNPYQHLQSSFRNIVRNPKLRTLSIASSLSFAIGETAFQFRPAFIEMLIPTWAIGVPRTLSNIGAAFSFYFAGGLIRRFGEFRLLIGGMFLSQLTHLGSLLVFSPLSPVLMSATSLFFGVNTVSVNGLMQSEFTSEQRATMGSISSFGGSLLFAVASFGIGALADRVGVVNALMITTLLGFIPIWLYRRALILRPSIETTQV